MTSTPEELKTKPQNSSATLEKLSTKDEQLLANSSLKSETQEIARKIKTTSEFSMKRIVKTCKTWEGDEKKIAMHLLAMKDLLDLGFVEDKIEDALKQCDNDRNRALHLLSGGHFLNL